MSNPWMRFERDQAEGVDKEERRRMRNQIRRTVRRTGRRARWLAIVEERDPELHAELLELRRYNPHAYRKRLIAAVKRMGFYQPVRRAAPRDLPPLAERRAAAEAEDRGSD